MANTISAALMEIRETIRLRALWTALASEDINDQHKRTTLGPLWLLVNYFAFVGVFLVIFGQNRDMNFFIGYLATGLFVWLYISDVLTQGTSLFLREESFIKGTPLPLFIYVMRMSTQSVIRSAYALIGWVALLWIAGTPVTPVALWSLFGLLIVVAVTPAAATILAFCGAYFPDLQFIMGILVRLGMFLTPIFWGYEGSTDAHGLSGLRNLLYQWNPFTYFLEIVRTPIVFDNVPVFALGVCLGITMALWMLAIVLLGALRKQVSLVI